MSINTLIISKEEARKIIEQEENHFMILKLKKFLVVKFKKKKIAVAFANADGGEFVIGIKDYKDESDTDKTLGMECQQ